MPGQRLRGGRGLHACSVLRPRNMALTGSSPCGEHREGEPGHKEEGTVVRHEHQGAERHRCCSDHGDNCPVTHEDAEHAGQSNPREGDEREKCVPVQSDAHEQHVDRQDQCRDDPDCEVDPDSGITCHDKAGSRAGLNGTTCSCVGPGVAVHAGRAEAEDAHWETRSAEDRCPWT